MSHVSALQWEEDLSYMASHGWPRNTVPDSNVCIWFINKHHGHTCNYHIPFCIKIISTLQIYSILVPPCDLNLVDCFYQRFLLFSDSAMLVGLGYHKIRSFIENIQFFHPNLDHISNMIYEQQNIFRHIIFFSKKRDKHTFVNWLFLVTILISSSVFSQTREWQGREHIVLGGRYFDLIVVIIFFNCLHE